MFPLAAEMLPSAAEVWCSDLVWLGGSSSELSGAACGPSGVGCGNGILWPQPACLPGAGGAAGICSEGVRVGGAK